MSLHALSTRRSVHASRPPAHVIATDGEAIAVVTKLAASFREGAQERDRDRILPWHQIEQLTDAGFFGISVPHRYGGAEVSAVTVAEVFRLLSAADPSIGQIPQNHFCWLPLIHNGTHTQAETFYARILKGARIGNAHSEATLRRQNDYEHRLEKVEGGFVITGRKFYSTGAIFADLVPFLDHHGPDGPRIFFAEADAEGLTILDDWRGMGQRTTASGTTVFERVFVPDTHVFPLGETAQNPLPFGLIASLIHTAVDVGIAEEVLVDAARYIRTQNRPWIDNPEEHFKEPFMVAQFGDYGVQVRSASVMLRHAAQAIDAARIDPSPDRILTARLAIAAARILASEAATRVANEFFLLTGARATLEQHGLDRHWRNARTHSLHDPLRWKRYYLGNYYLNGVVPGRGVYI
jgi:SfnB family sulfur acquisition oxidoreductase